MPATFALRIALALLFSLALAVPVRPAPCPAGRARECILRLRRAGVRRRCLLRLQRRRGPTWRPRAARRILPYVPPRTCTGAPHSPSFPAPKQRRSRRQGELRRLARRPVGHHVRGHGRQEGQRVQRRRWDRERRRRQPAAHLRWSASFPVRAPHPTLRSMLTCAGFYRKRGKVGLRAVGWRAWGGLSQVLDGPTGNEGAQGSPGADDARAEGLCGPGGRGHGLMPVPPMAALLVRWFLGLTSFDPHKTTTKTTERL